MKLNPDRIRAKLDDIAGAVGRLERFQSYDIIYNDLKDLREFSTAVARIV